MLRDLVQEVRELGLRGTAFRAGWELKKRSGAFKHLAATPDQLEPSVVEGQWVNRLPFPDPIAVVGALADRIPVGNLARLSANAAAATHGQILCFRRWPASFGEPIDWHLNPVSGERWNPDVPWAVAIREERRVGDVKLTWEIARFPQAYEMARAAAFAPQTSSDLAAALLQQFESFNEKNPFGLGVHWASGQETAIRLLAWLFALDVLLVRSEHREQASRVVAEGLQAAATHIEEHIDYARLAVYNNHLLTEALGLYIAGILLGNERWRANGRQILIDESHRQFYADGGYIQQSHNYHRVALQSLLCACIFAKTAGEAADDGWLRAMDRSLRLLGEHQNPVDGRLPNYGANDGALPMVLSTCDFSDFRPLLQSVSVMVRGKRIYEPGPWDETTAWLCGPSALELPLEKPRRRSTSFERTGYHVLRGNAEANFAAFRCGSILDRFSQIDMLNLDVWWRGLNVLVDPGSYLYNGAEEWHAHFLETSSHNTVAVDSRDQMLHYRRFKNLYWTTARLLGFEDQPGHAICSGEHYGYVRHPGGCVHRRSVLFVKDDLWVVADRVSGTGDHQLRLQWLAGQTAYDYRPAEGRLTLGTAQGVFSLAVFDEAANPMTGTVVAGQEHPPRGWLSRYYGECLPVASLVVEQTAQLPVTLITVLGGGKPTLTLSAGCFSAGEGEAQVRFKVVDGLISLVEPLARAAP